MFIVKDTLVSATMETAKTTLLRGQYRDGSSSLLGPDVQRINSGVSHLPRRDGSDASLVANAPDRADEATIAHDDYSEFRQAGQNNPLQANPLIGICMPPTDRVITSLKEGSNRSLSPRLNTLVEQMWRGIGQIADAENCFILQYPLPIWKSASILPFLAEPAVKGVVMMTGLEDPRPAQLAAAGIPVTLIGRSGEIPEGCGAVFALESDTVNLALSHLWRLGHRRIAHIAGPVEDTDAAASVTGRQEFASQVAKERLDCYATWMSVRREFDPHLVVRAGSWLAGPEFARRILREWKRMPNPPTAVFCANDSLAMDLLDAALHENVSVPRDLSIIGVDNIRPAMRTSPPLTTIELPAEDIGRAAMSLLLKLIDHTNFDSRLFEEDRTPIGFPVTKLIVRESTGPVSA